MGKENNGRKIWEFIKTYAPALSFGLSVES
jgi:hypothetical protein